MIINQFIKSFRLIKERNWDKIFVAIDIHDTILKACYYKQETFTFFPFAKKALRLMSHNPQISMILWTCSNAEALNQYIEIFKKEKIKFDYVNCNPECPSTDLANFNQKFYMNVGLDDKFGFQPYIDWLLIYIFFKWEEQIKKITKYLYAQYGKKN